MPAPDGARYTSGVITRALAAALVGALAAGAARAEALVSRWSPGPAISGRERHVALAAGSTLLVAGGSAGGAALTSVQVSLLGPGGVPGQWTDAPPLPAARTRACGVVIGSSLLIAGGADAAGALRSEIFQATLGADGKPGAWTQVATLPADRADHGCAALGGRLMVAGGTTGAAAGAGATDLFWNQTAGDLTTWASTATLPQALPAASLLAIGGGTGLLALDAGSSAALVTTADANHLPRGWTQSAAFPAQRAGVAFAAGEVDVIGLGGQIGIAITGEVRSAPLSSSAAGVAAGAWSLESRSLGPAAFGAAVALGGRVYFTGGLAPDGVDSGTVSYARLEDLPGTPALLAITAAPPVVAVGTTFSATVTVRDAAGNAATGAELPVTLALAAGTSVKLVGALNATTVGHVATFSGLSLDAEGSVALVATSPGLTGAASGPIIAYVAFDSSAQAAEGFGCSAGGGSFGALLGLLALLLLRRQRRASHGSHGPARALGALALAFSLLGPAQASAQAAPAAPRPKLTPDQLAKAKAANEEGNRQLAAGHFAEAVSAFEEALAIVRSPSVIYSLAETHRRAGHKDPAIAHYREYVEVAPKGPQRGEAERMLAQLGAPIAAASLPAAAPPPAMVAAPVAPPRAPVPAPAPAHAPAPVAASPAAPAQPGTTSIAAPPPAPVHAAAAAPVAAPPVTQAAAPTAAAAPELVGPTGPPSKADIAKARALDAEGKRAAADGRADEAARAFLQAFALTGSPTAIFNAADAHRAAGHREEALRLYRECAARAKSGTLRNEAEAMVARLSGAPAAAPAKPPAAVAVAPAPPPERFAAPPVSGHEPSAAPHGQPPETSSRQWSSPCDHRFDDGPPYCSSRFLVDTSLAADPSNKAVGGQVLFGVHFAPGESGFQWALAGGVSLAQRPGLIVEGSRMLFATAVHDRSGSMNAAQPAFSLAAEARLRVAPLSGGLALGGGAGLQARTWIAGPLSATCGLAVELIHAPAGTIVAPLLLVGLRADL